MMKLQQLALSQVSQLRKSYSSEHVPAFFYSTATPEKIGFATTENESLNCSPLMRTHRKNLNRTDSCLETAQSCTLLDFFDDYTKYS